MINVYDLDEGRVYTAEELKAVYDEHKQTVTFENYYKEKRVYNFVLLNQNKTVNVGDYPYGRLRANVKYSIISNSYGEALVFQSQNPKNSVWNKPKKSGYSDLGFMIINEEGHIKTMSLCFNDGESKNEAFKVFVPCMSEKQKKVYARICGYTETMKSVTFEIKKTYWKNRTTGEVTDSVNVFDLNNVDKCDENGVLIDEEKEKREQEKVKDSINKNIVYQSVMKYKEIKKVN